MPQPRRWQSPASLLLRLQRQHQVRALGVCLLQWLDHSSSRQYEDVIDGDLCEQFPTLPADLPRKIAYELDRTPREILKKLEDIRNKII